MDEQKGGGPPPVARRRATRHQPRRETRTECLEQRIDILTELVSTLVTALGQNAANAIPAIPPGIPLANAEGEEDSPPQEGGNIADGEAQGDTDARRMRARHRRQTRRENRGNTSDLRSSEHTRDLVFNRLERVRVDPKMDGGYDSENECSVGSWESTDLRARLNTRGGAPVTNTSLNRLVAN